MSGDFPVQCVVDAWGGQNMAASMTGILTIIIMLGVLGILVASLF